jgi:hypothetical protein
LVTFRLLGEQGQGDTTYYIAVDGYSNRMVDFNLNYRFGQPPANDQFANASVLSTSSGEMRGSTMNALAEIEEPEQSGAINSLWWKWTAPQDGIFSIDPSNSPIDTYVSVFSGSKLNILTVLAQSNSENLQERIKIPVQAGVTYYIAADGYDNILGDILLTYQFELPPANDKRVNAIELTGTSGRELGSNQTALAEVGEPEQSGTINSVWWKWTAPQDGLFILDTFGSNFDTYLSLFSGSPSNLTLLAQNDDTSGVQSLVKAQVRAGDTYYIAVDGYNENTGNITLNYQFGPSPTNDKFTQAIELTNPTGTVLGTTVNAFAEAGEPAQSGTINSVWWKWIAPRDGTFTVDTMGSSGNPYLSVLKGSSVNTLTVLGQQAGQQPMQITVQANTTYYIAVDGTDNTTGGVTLNYRFTANNVAPTDLRLSATQVSEGQPVGTLVGSFSTVDADADNTFSYRLVAGPGDEGNGLFTIVGHQLYTHHVFDYETQQRYSIRVQTQDNRGGTYEKVLTIAIIDNVRDNFTSSIHAALATDTAAGGVNSDGITSEPTIQGTISEPHQLVSLRAGVDAMPTTAFANVLPDLQADGSFRFSRARLEAIAGKRLSDGAHVVQLQATDRYGNTKSLAVSFTLDTTTPTFEVQGLIDGISWSTTERLKGQLKQIDPDVWMVYQFDDQGETELLINADGTFNKLLAVPSQAGEHTLKVSSIDQAGNRQTKAFRFLVKPQRVAIDDDLLTSSSGDGGEGDGSGIDGGSSSGGGSGGNGGTGSGTTGSGSPAMEWWLYVGGNSSGSNGGSGSPPPPPPPPPPPEAPPTYLEKVAIILDRALYSMGEEEETIHKKAALKNRITMLMELAAIVDHYQMYDQMEGVLHGIYDEAEETIQTRDEASERGVDLAIQLLEDSDAVRTEVYQSALLTVANQVWVDNQYPALSEDQQQQLVNGLLELGRTYAALKPTLAPDTATTTTPDFLDALWRAQLPSDPSTPKPYPEIRAELLRGITALDTLLDGVEDPLGALRFVNNLVQAVTNIESLSDNAVLDAQFLRELVNFGFEYAKLNPTVLTTATENGTEAFLATLWQSESTEAESIAVKEATGKLSELFAGFDTPEARLQWLRFAMNLVQAVGQSLAPEENADPTVVSALIELGAMYAQLNPTPASTEPPLNFFLDTLWQAQDDIGLRTGAEQLQSFVQDIADPTRLLRLATGLLRAMESLSLERPPDAQMLAALLEFGKAYAALDPIATTTEGDEPLNFFLDTFWQAQDDAAIQKGTEEFKNFFETTNSPSLPLLQFATNLLKVTKLAPEELQEQKNEPKFLSALVQLGSAYAALNPIVNSENESLNFFLSTIWGANHEQNMLKGAQELATQVKGFDKPIKLIEYQQKLLTTLKLVPSLQQAEYNPFFVEGVFVLGSYYASLQEAGEQTDVSSNFLSDVWKSKTKEDLELAANSLQKILTPIIDENLVGALPTQLDQYAPTSLHRQVISLARQTAPDPDVQEWNIFRAGLAAVGSLNLYEFKTQWIYGYRNIINYAVSLFDIPAILLAGVAHVEVGGKPYEFDEGVYIARGILPDGAPGTLGIPAGQTSFGDLSVQLETAARVLGYVSVQELNQSRLEKLINPQQTSLILESLRDPRQNILIAAAYLASIKDIYAPEKAATELTEEDMIVIASAYNLGEYKYDGENLRTSLELRSYEELLNWGYGQLAVRDRVEEYQLNRVLMGAYPNE